jgi:hypothetical protein
MKHLRVLLWAVALAGCTEEPQSRFVEGYQCNNLTNSCPPGTECVPRMPRVSDSGGRCAVVEANTCVVTDEAFCTLIGYGCINGACLPEQRCTADAECPDGLCWFGPWNGTSFSPGICTSIGDDCSPPPAVPVPSNSCWACVWGQQELVRQGVYSFCPAVDASLRD